MSAFTAAKQQIDLATITLQSGSHDSPESGACRCGCGQPAPLATRTIARINQVRGQPLHFISGHNGRGRSKQRSRLAIRQHADGLASVQLSNGAVALIDATDAELIAKHVWHLDTAGYARAMLKVNGRWKLVRMHSLLMQSPDGLLVDHRDCDKLNNSRSNLRLCTPTQSMGNIRKYAGTSVFKGVHWDKNAGKWTARIRHKGRHLYLGLFQDEAVAGAAYAAAATQFRGEFARLA